MVIPMNSGRCSWMRLKTLELTAAHVGRGCLHHRVGRTRLANANLEDARLAGVDLTGVDLVGARLRGAFWPEDISPSEGMGP